MSNFSELLDYYHYISNKNIYNTDDDILKFLNNKSSIIFIKKDFIILDYYLNLYRQNKLNNNLIKNFKNDLIENRGKNNCRCC